MKRIIIASLVIVILGICALALYPKFHSWRMGVGNSSEALDADQHLTFTSMEETEPVNLEDRMLKAHYFLEKGFLSLAATELTAAVALDPKSIEPLKELAQVYIDLEEYSKAEEVLNRLLAIDQANEDAVVMLGQIHIKKSDFESARNYFSKVQKTPGVLYYLGLIESVIGDPKKAEGLLKEAKTGSNKQKLIDNVDELLVSFQEFSLYPDSEIIYYKTLLARSLDRIDEFEMAIYLLREVLKEKVDYRDAWTLLGYAYLSLDKTDFALTCFEKAYQVDPESAEVQYFLGLTYAQLEKYKESIIYLNIALKNGFEPQVQAKQKLAELYFETEDYAQSVAMYEDVLKLNDSNIDLFVRPIWIYLDYLKNTDQSLALADKALEKHPKDAMAYNLAGWVRSERGELEQAQQLLKNSIALDGSLAGAYFNLGTVYQRAGQNSDALNVYKKAYSLDRFGPIGQKAAESYNTLIIQ